jgi:hypothetical protein
LIASDHKVQHTVFHVAGGGDWDELDAAIDEARELGLPIGFYKEDEDPSITQSLEDKPTGRGVRPAKPAKSTMRRKARGR